MLTNSAGDVAIKQIKNIQKLVEVGNSQYVFMIRGGTSLAWIRPDDVNKVLAITGGCNCPNNTHANLFRLANEDDVRRFETNNPR